MTEPKICPLCGNETSRPSLFGPFEYKGRQFLYRECLSCGSHYCDPMPDAATLAEMYGPEYVEMWYANERIDDPKESQRVTDSLSGFKTGTFLDYGCGTGDLLRRASSIGWKVMGVELDSKVAELASVAAACTVVSTPDTLVVDGEGPANVLHLGDVIEHLTDLEHQFPAILRLLKPDGVLLAQGPLEAGPTLFNMVMALWKRIAPAAGTRVPPYHVIMATIDGQRRFFRRAGLQEIEYRVHEVAWPAPSKLAPADLRRPRRVFLFIVRRLSQIVSKFAGGRLANRYFYVGRKPENV